jgi:flagellar protein FlbT
MAPMRISLQPGERIFVNGAVLRVDRKVSVEFLNDVTFLLENHVLQSEDATTPLRQLYYVLQTILIDPANAPHTLVLFRHMHGALLASFDNHAILSEIKFIDGLVGNCRYFEALKRLRALFPLEDAILSPAPKPEKPHFDQSVEMAACK